MKLDVDDDLVLVELVELVGIVLVDVTVAVGTGAV
jgi:hypothetical protein